MRIADLREATGYSNMQLHRGLDRLIQGGEVLREGGQRKTVFRLASRKLRGQGSSPASGNAKPSPKGEAQPRISTSAVAKAALGNLRGRRNGLGMAELREATGYTRAQLHRALVTLHQEGKIHRTGEPHALRYHFRR